MLVEASTNQADAAAIRPLAPIGFVAGHWYRYKPEPLNDLLMKCIGGIQRRYELPPTIQLAVKCQSPYIQTTKLIIELSIAIALLLLALLPACLTWRNLQIFRQLPQADATVEAVSVLIPARNEAEGIEQTLQSVLASLGEFEVIVLDDHSTDATHQIVTELASKDSRLKICEAPELPAQWNGKQHACWRLAGLAQHELLLFLDADVRLQPDAVQRAAAEIRRLDVSLLSGFPNQEMHSWSEKLLIPMMHVLLLGYLPLDQMRKSDQPGLGAGCGQFFLADRASYLACEGHKSIRGSRHDGLMLPRSFRRAGMKTDLFDGSDIASVRMYRGASEVASGVAKNATEGIANWRLIGLFTLLLGGAAVLPLLMLAHAIYWGWSALPAALIALALILGWLPRLFIARRLQQPWLGVVLHPLAVILFLALQWYAFLRQLLGFRAIAWRGRS